MGIGDLYARQVMIAAMLGLVYIFSICIRLKHKKNLNYNKPKNSSLSQCPHIPTENIVEMSYSTPDKTYKFLVSLHPPALDHVISKGIKDGLYGPKHKYPSIDEMHSICSFHTAECESGKVFVEVGSATGVVSVYMASRGMDVYAYDPVLPNAERLSESRCLNSELMCGNSPDCITPFSPSKFHVLWNAVGSDDQVIINVESEPFNLAATMRGGGSYQAQVNVVTIDDTVKEDSIEILLLTCQGSEYDALLGASEFLKSGKIRNIVWRRHSSRPEHDKSAASIMKLLKYHGYEFFELDSARSMKASPTTRSYEEMSDYVQKLHMKGRHPNILASLMR